MKVKDLIKSLENFEQDEEITNTILCTLEKTYIIKIKETKKQGA